jgi:uncharacterized Zn finger protein (UPF0148 family)
MKPVCKMCGKELVEQDGINVCQNCHKKYSVEEIKKILTKIDPSAKSNGHEYIIK